MLSSDTQHTEYRDAGSYCAFQVVLNDKDHDNYKWSIDNFEPSNNGIVDYDFPEYDSIMIRWGKILKETSLKTTEHDTIANIYAVKDRDEFANSVCGIKHAVRRSKVLASWAGVLNNNVYLKLENFKDIAEQKYVTFYITAAVNRYGAAVPYQPLTIVMEYSWLGGIPWFIILAIITVIGALGYAVYYFRGKSAETQAKLDFEMNDIRNVARVPYSDDIVERATLHDDV